MTFSIFRNSFEGALPESGIHVMLAMRYFAISENGFRGTLPESGLRTMRAIGMLRVRQNRFAGALPDDCREWSRIEIWTVNYNHFEGLISLADAKAKALRFPVVTYNS
eukprot:3304874-Amphidinium_carterae.1